MMTYVLYIVTGAPGSGKTTAVESLLRIAKNSDYAAFDIDWLAESASNLARRDIHVDQSTWTPYCELWFEVLHATCKNGKTPVFFAPTDPSDVEENGKPAWCKGIEWFLLDCDDETRRQRLAKRRSWTEAEIDEAIADASWLRQQGVGRYVDTGRLSPAEVGWEIHEWLVQSRTGAVQGKG